MTRRGPIDRFAERVRGARTLEDFEKHHDDHEHQTRNEKCGYGVFGLIGAFGDGAAACLGRVGWPCRAEFDGSGHGDLFAAGGVAACLVIGAEGGCGGVDEIGLVAAHATVERVAQGFGGAGIGRIWHGVLGGIGVGVVGQRFGGKAVPVPDAGNQGQTPRLKGHNPGWSYPMQNEAREMWMDWLRDAHAMESQAETMLNAQAGRLENYPALRMRIEQHLRETTAQREQLERLFETLGEEVSAVKAGMGKLMALGQGLAGAFASDEVMKGSIASYAFEQMEIASYTALIAGAEELGMTEAVAVLEPILEQERAMAAWLAENLPPLTRSFLARAEADLEAKR